MAAAGPRPRFTMGHALAVAAVVHILLLLTAGLFPQAFAAPAFLLADEEIKPPPVKFTFIDVSDENEVESNPDATLVSDRDRVEAGEVPPVTTPDGKLPPSRGNTPEKVARAGDAVMVPPSPPARSLPRVQPPEPQVEQAAEESAPDEAEADDLREEAADSETPRPQDLTETGEAAAGNPARPRPDSRQDLFRRALDREASRSLPTDLQAVAPPEKTPPRAPQGGSLEWQFNNPNPAYPVKLGSLSFDSKGAYFGDWRKEFHIRVLAEWNRNIREWHTRVMNEIASAAIPADPAVWNAYAQRINSTRGVTGINFIVTREGSVIALELVHPSGTVELDRSVQKTLRNVLLPPLPDDYPDDMLPIQAGFYYNVEPPSE